MIYDICFYQILCKKFVQIMALYVHNLARICVSSPLALAKSPSSG